MSPTLEQILEAALFSSPRALSMQQLIRLLDGEHAAAEIRSAIAQLNQTYDTTQRAFRIDSVAKGFQLRTQPQYKTWIRQVESLKPIKLSLSVIETLAIIAYKQPITRAGVESVRGVDSAYTLRSLVDKRLIKIVGKEEVPGRPSLYGTSPLFLEVFGLKDLKSLPSLSELEEVLEDPQTDFIDAME